MFVVYCSVCADAECHDGERGRVQVLAHGYSWLLQGRGWGGARFPVASYSLVT